MLIQIHQEQVELLPEKAIFWPAMELLLIADIGYAFTQKTSIESGHDELEHIKGVLLKRSVKRIILLGDVVNEGRSIDKRVLLNIKSWSQHLQCPFYIAFPKSSFIPSEGFKDYGVAAWADPLIIPPFAFTKAPIEISRYFTFSGHIHPQVILKKGNERMSFPCFQIKQSLAILPSFVDEAPSQPISWTSEERIYAIDGHDIISL